MLKFKALPSSPESLEYNIYLAHVCVDQHFYDLYANWGSRSISLRYGVTCLGNGQNQINDVSDPRRYECSRTILE